MTLTLNEGCEDCAGKRWTRADLSQSRLNTWLDCRQKYFFQYIERLARKNKVFFPQGQIVHHALEVFINDHQKGLNPPIEYYLMEMDTEWTTEIEKGKLYDNKGTALTEKETETALEDCQRWVRNFITAVQEGDFKNYDLTKVIATEADVRRKIPGTDFYLRGRIDWVVDMNGPVAKLADLKTASTHWMGAWTQNKADTQLQATTYGWISGLPLEFTYVILYKTKEGEKVKLDTFVTTRDQRDYGLLESTLRSFLKDTNYPSHDGFEAFPQPDGGTKYNHCGKLCDHKDECYARFFDPNADTEGQLGE